MRWRDSPHQNAGTVRGMKKRPDEVRGLSAHVSNMKMRTCRVSSGGRKPHREPVEAYPGIPSRVPVTVHTLLGELVVFDAGGYQQSIETKRLKDRLGEASALSSSPCRALIQMPRLRPSVP
jgi:hypothetical protein